MQEKQQKEEKRNPINLYNCKRCGNTIITEDKDEGVTPASLPCEMFGGCSDGRMWSFYYNVPPILVASHEWFKDGDSEALNIRKIQELRPEPFGTGIPPNPNIKEPIKYGRQPPTKGQSGRTSLHEKFGKSKRKH